MSVNYVDFREADLDGLLEAWRRFYPERYHVTGDLLRRNTLDSPLLDWGASFVAKDGDKTVGFVAVKKSPSKLYKCQDRDAVFVNSIAFDYPEIGLDLMARAKQVLTERGHTNLWMGQDSGHFFPGCPDDVKRLGSLLLVEGFQESGQVHDLERDLRGYVNPAKPTADGEYRMLRAEEQSSLEKLIKSNFSPRWLHDTKLKITGEQIESTVFGLVLEGEVEGFAVIQSEGHTLPIGGAVWHRSLGEHWGALGPIGVSQKVRGKGYGNALLGAALENLRDRCVENCIIDWTTLTEFYGKHGFEVTRTYNSLMLELEAK